MEQRLITYMHKGTELEGFFAYDPSKTGKLPAVIICHAWAGRDKFACEKALELAGWGYAAFALDLYGKGVVGASKEQNSALMGPFMQDRAYLLDRLQAGYKVLYEQPNVDVSKIAAMGFCFGGLCSLDLARGGTALRGAISVHGLLKKPEGLKPRLIKSKILALHGHEDPMVPPEQVLEFENEMTEAGADWQVHVYGQTMHAFTNPKANDPAFGTVYNPVAAKRAWQSIRLFLEECLR